MNINGLEQSSSSSRTFVSSLLSSEHPKPSYSFSLHSSPPFLRSAETVSAIVLITKLSTRMSCRVPLSLIFIFANPTHSFICEFSKELLNIYSVPGNILAAHDTKSYRTHSWLLQSITESKVSLMGTQKRKLKMRSRRGWKVRENAQRQWYSSWKIIGALEINNSGKYSRQREDLWKVHKWWSASYFLGTPIISIWLGYSVQGKVSGNMVGRGCPNLCYMD